MRDVVCRKYKGTNGGFAVQFGACKDSQTAADTASLSGGTHTGAATFLFIQACERLLKHQQPLTCGPRQNPLSHSASPAPLYIMCTSDTSSKHVQRDHAVHVHKYCDNCSRVRLRAVHAAATCVLTRVIRGTPIPLPVCYPFYC